MSNRSSNRPIIIVTIVLVAIFGLLAGLPSFFDNAELRFQGEPVQDVISPTETVQE
jgi:hypothetical protein